MPLRDHFRPQVSARHSWDALHGMLPAVLVQALFGKLPPGYAAAPNVHLGAFEIDLSAHEEDASFPATDSGGGAGTATATRMTLTPTATLAADLWEVDEYEVRIYDDTYDRRLVAAVEIVSPSNKDRPGSRRAFAAKCAALLRRDICVSIVDVVTDMHFNLYGEALGDVAATDPTLGAGPPHIYAVTMRPRKPTRKSARRGAKLDVWFTPLELGRPLPSIPLWLAEDVVTMLDLEPPYEDACRVLHIA